MCVGGLFSAPKAPIAPPRQTVAPTMKAAAPPSETVSPERIKEEGTDEDKISTKKKKALEIQKVREGVKTFGAIDPKTLPTTPQGGVNTP